MIRAQAIGLHARADQVVEGNQIAIYDAQGQPVAIVVAISPTLTRFYSVAADQAEFNKAAEQLGVKPLYEVKQLVI